MTSHHPPHIYLDESWYIVTASTVDHTRFLVGNAAKSLLCDKLKELVLEFKITLRASVILDNHYHLLLKTFRGRDLSHFFGKLHGGTAWQINQWEGTPGRQIWHNYSLPSSYSQEGRL